MEHYTRSGALTIDALFRCRDPTGAVLILVAVERCGQKAGRDSIILTPHRESSGIEPRCDRRQRVCFARCV